MHSGMVARHPIAGTIPLPSNPLPFPIYTGGETTFPNIPAVSEKGV